MRSGELVLPAGATFDPAKHLSPTDVVVDNIVNPSIMRIRLKSSKTDQTRAGIDLFVGRTHNLLCPIVAMLRYLALRGFQQGPLFRWSDGSPLTRPRLVDKIKALLSEAGVNPTITPAIPFKLEQQQLRQLMASRMLLFKCSVGGIAIHTLVIFELLGKIYHSSHDF